MATKKAAKKVVPSLQGATAAILERVANWIDVPTATADGVVFGGASKQSKEEWAVLVEARKLAVNYIRLGAKQ
jgi:hypothetical protein